MRAQWCNGACFWLVPAKTGPSQDMGINPPIVSAPPHSSISRHLDDHPRGNSAEAAKDHTWAVGLGPQQKVHPNLIVDMTVLTRSSPSSQQVSASLLLVGTRADGSWETAAWRRCDLLPSVTRRQQGHALSFGGGTMAPEIGRRLLAPYAAEVGVAAAAATRPRPTREWPSSNPLLPFHPWWPWC